MFRSLFFTVVCAMFLFVSAAGDATPEDVRRSKERNAAAAAQKIRNTTTRVVATPNGRVQVTSVPYGDCARGLAIVTERKLD